MDENSLPPILIQRLANITTWLNDRKYLLTGKKTKIILNLSDEHIKGEITLYPDSNQVVYNLNTVTLIEAASLLRPFFYDQNRDRDTKQTKKQK